MSKFSNPIKYVFILMLFCFSVGNLFAADQTCPKILDHSVQLLGSSKDISLCNYQGQVILAVNTASQCGFTPQFEGLEKLYQKYKDQGLVILGFPSNSFQQESRSSKDIAAFCKLNYGVSFPMMEKIEVKGENAHGFYQNLKQASGTEPKWNFFKYLIDPQGEVVHVWSSMVKPESEAIEAAIQTALDVQDQEAL